MALAPLGLGLALARAIRAGDAAPPRAARAVALGLFALALTVATGALGEFAAHAWTRDPLRYPALAGLVLAPVLLTAAVTLGPWFAATAAAVMQVALYVGLDLLFGSFFPHRRPPSLPPLVLAPALVIDLAVGLR